MLRSELSRTPSEDILALLCGHRNTCSRKHVERGEFGRFTHSREARRTGTAAGSADRHFHRISHLQYRPRTWTRTDRIRTRMQSSAGAGICRRGGQSIVLRAAAIREQSSGTIDAAKGTITLPLYQGSIAGSKKTVWYILTDVDDQGVATLLGLNYSAKLSYAANGARTANLDENGNLVFDKGTVDFSPVRSIVPGPPGAEFPPQSAQPGAIGDKDYSPLVRVLNSGGVIYNAPMMAFGVGANDINFPNGGVDYSKVHDQVVAIDPINMTVTLNVINGFSFGRPVWYLSTEASIPLAAAIEHNTFAPLMQNIVLGRDDSFTSPIERIFIATNGPESGGCQNPLRQGLSADLADGARPNNVLGGIPTIATDYSPVWDAQLFSWTQAAISQGFRGQVREEFQILTFVQDGLITGPGGNKFGSSGFSINCPIAQRLD